MINVWRLLHYLRLLYNTKSLSPYQKKKKKVKRGKKDKKMKEKLYTNIQETF